MNLTPDAGQVLVSWKLKAGHLEDDEWIVDDAAGVRSGPPGKVHAAPEGSNVTYCGKAIPADAEPALHRAARLADLCHNCLRTVMRPYL